ncbi:MAG: nucleotidyltransferase [Lachnospiraceae bacterium]|nr:nucleotidyltransferase [Lachnospiraceae bacterium]
MKVCGIVAEYNPLHNGHLYHLQEAKRISGADYIIVVMGGNFMQRGTPAIMDKFERTRAALSCGADLVLELPSYYATGSAEYFATGAVSLLTKLGVVDTLCFGSECGDVEILKQIAHIIVEETESYQSCLQSYLRSGNTYPAARLAAILKVCPEISSSITILNSPNNILGIEYIKSIIRQESSLVPITMKRCGSDYHDKRLGINQSSSSALREALWSGVPLSELQDQMPEAAYQILDDYLQNNQLLHLNDFSEIMYYKLLSEHHKGFEDYIDVSPALSDRICNNLYKFDGYEAFCDLLKTKEVTYTRISRCLYHIMLNMRKDELDLYMNELGITPYARVLGFRKDATPIFSEIDKKTQIPLVTKLADAHNILSEQAYEMLLKEITINDIYSSIRASKAKIPMYNEFSTPIVIV